VAVLDIYRRYYGLRVALLLLGVSYAAMALAAYIVELIFGVAGLVPQQRSAQIARRVGHSESEIASCGHDPVRSYAFHPAPAKLAFGDDAAYSITSSARSSMPGGTVRPSALAVLRLMISENFVGS